MVTNVAQKAKYPFHLNFREFLSIPSPLSPKKVLGLVSRPFASCNETHLMG